MCFEIAFSISNNWALTSQIYEYIDFLVDFSLCIICLQYCGKISFIPWALFSTVRDIFSTMGDTIINAGALIILHMYVS